MSEYFSRALVTILDNLPLEALLLIFTLASLFIRDRFRYSKILRQLRDRNHSEQVVTAELIELIHTENGVAMVIRELPFCRRLVDVLSVEAIKLLSAFSKKSCIRDARIFALKDCQANVYSDAMKGVYELLFRFFKTSMSGNSDGDTNWYYCIPTCFTDSTQLKVLRFLVVPKEFMEALADDEFWWAKLEVEKQAHHEHLIALRQISLELKRNGRKIPGVQLLQYRIFTAYTPNQVNPPKPINWLTQEALDTLEKVGIRVSSLFPKELG